MCVFSHVSRVSQLDLMTELFSLGSASEERRRPLANSWTNRRTLMCPTQLFSGKLLADLLTK